MSTTSLQKRPSAGAIALRILRQKYQAALFLPKLVRGFLKFDADGELVADNNPQAFALKAAAYTAVSGDRLAVDTSDAAVTITLPASPSAGDVVEVLDASNTFDTNNLTVARNSSNINSAGSNLTVSTEGARVILVYIDSTIGWRALYLAAAADSLAVSNNATVGGTLGVTGNTTLGGTAAVTGLTTLTGGAAGGIQALSGAGAVNVTTLTTALTTTDDAQALTLANGTNGQIKTIIHDVDGGSAVLTPTTATGFTTITFTDVGDSATLQFLPTRGWYIPVAA